MSKELNKAHAEEVLEICRNLEYTSTLEGKRKQIKLNPISDAIFVSSEEFDKIRCKPVGMCEDVVITNFSVVADAFRFQNMDKSKKVGILNFASAYNPGGGFINGAIAQEEALCHSSTLYMQLKNCEILYDSNRKENNKFYTDNMAYSETQFFMDADRVKRPIPITCGVITSAAVNISKLKSQNATQEELEQAVEIMKTRMHKVIQLAVNYKLDILILGAFGCGVFGNDPETVAEIWKDELLKYGGHFSKVVFSILGDKEGANYKAFNRVFSDYR